MMFPTTAVDYLGQLHNAYRANREIQYLVMFVSRELYQRYEGELVQNTRYTGQDGGWVYSLLFRDARVKVSPRLQGFKVHFIEDEHVYYS